MNIYSRRCDLAAMCVVSAHFQNTTEIWIQRVDLFLKLPRCASLDGHVSERHKYFDVHASVILVFSSTSSGIGSHGA